MAKSSKVILKNEVWRSERPGGGILLMSRSVGKPLPRSVGSDTSTCPQNVMLAPHPVYLGLDAISFLMTFTVLAKFASLGNVL